MRVLTEEEAPAGSLLTFRGGRIQVFPFSSPRGQTLTKLKRPGQDVIPRGAGYWFAVRGGRAPAPAGFRMLGAAQGLWVAV